MRAEDALALAKSYTKKSLAGAGALKGDPGVGIASITQTTESTDGGGVNVVTVTKTDGSQASFNVRNGMDGATIDSANINASGELVQYMNDGRELNAGTVPTVKGDPGYSPTATVERNAADDGVVITVTDETGTTTAELKDGEGGAGVPTGGATGQVLTKKSDTDGDFEWKDPAAEVVTDDVPTEDSTNPVQSGGTYTALQNTLKAAQEYADAKLHLSKEIVDAVPTADVAQENVIYLFKVDTATGSDVYQEWQLINGEMVLTGDTSTDLSGYAKTEDLEDKQDKLVGTAGQFVGFDADGNALAQEVLTVLTGVKGTIVNDFGNYQINMNPAVTYTELKEMVNAGKRIVLRVYESAIGSEKWEDFYYTGSRKSDAFYFYSLDGTSVRKAFCASTTGWMIGDIEIGNQPFIIKSAYTYNAYTGDLQLIEGSTDSVWSDWYNEFDEYGRTVIWELHKDSVGSEDEVIRMYPNYYGIYLNSSSTRVRNVQFSSIGVAPNFNKFTVKYLYIGWWDVLDTYSVKRLSFPEIPVGGSTGYVLAKASDENYSTKWVDPISLIPDTGDLVITGEYSVGDDGTWTVSNVSETFATVDAALVAGQSVSLKIYPEGTTENPYILYPAMHYANMGIMFALAVGDGGQITTLNVMLTPDGSTVVTPDNYKFDEKQDKLTGTQGQVVGFDENGNAVAQDTPLRVAYLEDGAEKQASITKGALLSEYEPYTDRNGKTGYIVDDLYFTYDSDKLAEGINAWIAEKGITLAAGTEYPDLTDIYFYNASTAGAVYASTKMKVSANGAAPGLSYVMTYGDVDYNLFTCQINSDYATTNSVAITNMYGFNVFNLAKLITGLSGCYITETILDDFHGWFTLHKPIGLSESLGTPSPTYDKTAALMDVNDLVSVGYGSTVGSFDLGNIVGLMTSPLQKLFFTVDKAGSNLGAYANNETARQSALSSGFLTTNLLATKNTFSSLDDMSTLPSPPSSAFGVYTVKPDSAGQPGGETAGGTLIVMHITSSLYSSTAQAIGTRLAVFVTRNALYYKLGLGGTYYPTSSWDSSWYKISEVAIDDTTTSETSTWSSNQIEERITHGVADVPAVSITSLADETNFELGSASNFYSVRNGVCYFQIYLKVKIYTTSYVSVLEGMPKPAEGLSLCWTFIPYTNYEAKPSLRLNISSSGNASASYGVVDAMYMCCGSYPVA